jgi:glycosyltransferase involved in cell wall biosynthesis
MIRRLMVVTGHRHGSATGGSENTIDELCATVKAAGVAAAVVAAAPAGQKAPLAREERADYALFHATDVRVLPQAMAAFGPDAVLATVDLRAMLMAELEKIEKPVAIYIQDVMGHGPSTFYPRTPAILYLANSPFMAARAKIQWGVEAQVLPPLIRPERYRADGGARNEALFVNPIPLKGIEMAFALARHRPDVRFRFQESWKLPAVWRNEQMPRLSDCGNIEWAAPVADMRPVYGAAKLVLAPSVAEEGWGRTVTEGQFSGIPSLASDRGALPETVGGAGVVVPLAAPVTEWCAQFDRIWDDADFYGGLSREALRRAGDPQLTPEAVSGRLLDLLARHAQRRPRGNAGANG